MPSSRSPTAGSALARAEATPPDAIVLDVAMPGMDGLAVARRLRSKGVSTPILMLTARDERRRSRRRARLRVPTTTW